MISSPGQTFTLQADSVFDGANTTALLSHQIAYF